MEYLNFEGNIPKGEYGAGSMIVWDRGRWEPEGDAQKGAVDKSREFRASRGRDQNSVRPRFPALVPLFCRLLGPCPWLIEHLPLHIVRAP